MGDRYSSRRHYERRLRIRYRKKLWSTGIIMLVIGLIVGFIGCTVAVNKSARVSELLGIAPKQDVATDLPLPTPTPFERASVYLISRIICITLTPV